MTEEAVLEWLKLKSTRATIDGMKRYCIPNHKAFGVPMGEMRKFAKTIGTDHSLAQKLWENGWFEPRTIAVFVADPKKLTSELMDRWASQFDSWAICDTACFHLFDRTPHAWRKVSTWDASGEEFVRRAAFALVWALSIHDKQAGDAAFKEVLSLMEHTRPDDRPLVNKAMDMALRAIGKRNKTLNKAALSTARQLAGSKLKSRAWIGSHSERELASERVQAKFD